MPSAWFARRPLPEERRAPPLWAMPAAAGVAFLVLGTSLTWFWLGLRAKEKAYREDDRHRLAEMAVAQKDGGEGLLRIVGIGTSLLNAGTPDDRGMAILGDRSGVAVRYVRICRGWGAFSNWRGTMQAVRSAGPDMVLVEDQCLFYVPRMWVIARMSSLDDVVGRIKALFGTLVSPRTTDVAQGRPNPGRLVRQHREDRIRLLRFGLRPDAREILQEFRQARIPVVILCMPIHPRARSMRQEWEGPAIDRSLDELERERLVTVLRCPLRFEPDEYTDLIHLTAEGREKYSRWLIETLAARWEH